LRTDNELLDTPYLFQLTFALSSCNKTFITHVKYRYLREVDDQPTTILSEKARHLSTSRLQVNVVEAACGSIGVLRQRDEAVQARQQRPSYTAIFSFESLFRAPWCKQMLQPANLREGFTVDATRF